MTPRKQGERAMRHLLNLIRNQRGATAIEYALVASLISIAAIAGFNSLSEQIDAKFEAVDTAM
jgi:pilus assembly protein Flp/PilA